MRRISAKRDVALDSEMVRFLLEQDGFVELGSAALLTRTGDASANEAGRGHGSNPQLGSAATSVFGYSVNYVPEHRPGGRRRPAGF